jgi:hypothetical protein
MTNLSKAKTETRFVDPLTFQSFKEGDNVNVTTPTGAIVTFRVNSISEDTVVLELPAAKVLASRVGSTVINKALIVGKATIRPGEPLKITFKDGKSESYKVDLVFDHNLLIVSPPGRKKFGLLEKLKLIWQGRNL